jgi:hypothetical protein
MIRGAGPGRALARRGLTLRRVAGAATALPSAVSARDEGCSANHPGHRPMAFATVGTLAQPRPSSLQARTGLWTCAPRARSGSRRLLGTVSAFLTFAT